MRRPRDLRRLAKPLHVPDGRLPRDVVPTGYRLDLTVDPAESHFSGYVEIDVAIRQPVAMIWLHGNRLQDITVTLRLAETKDPMSRRQIVQALGRASEPAAAARVRSLTLGKSVRANEIFTVLRGQMALPRTRRAAWEWLQASFDELLARLPAHHAGYLPRLAANFCSRDAAAAVSTFFTPRVASLPGGPRNLASSLEAIELCAARIDAHRDDAARFFAGHNAP